MGQLNFAPRCASAGYRIMNIARPPFGPREHGFVACAYSSQNPTALQSTKQKTLPPFQNRELWWKIVTGSIFREKSIRQPRKRSTRFRCASFPKIELTSPYVSQYNKERLSYCVKRLSFSTNRDCGKVPKIAPIHTFLDIRVRKNE
jgi:hypothetical protein